MAGKLVEVNETAKSIKVEVTIQYSKPNFGEIQALRNCKIQLAQAIATRLGDHVEPAAANDPAQPHSPPIEKKTQQVDVTGTDDVKVRLTDPPPAYDDKGNIKKRTDKELKELKGDPKDPDYKLPGYPAQFTDMRQGSYVKVTLVKKKETHPTRPQAQGRRPQTPLATTCRRRP